MARPIKKGLDYYPVDTDMFQDIKIRRLARRCKRESIALYLQILCDIYKHSFYLQWDDDYCFELAEQSGMSERGLKNVVAYMAEIGLFDEKMFRKGILTSCAIQRRYFLVKGKSISVEESENDYLLVPVSAGKTPDKTPENPQSKEKERKENMSERACARARDMEQWEAWKEELLADGSWRQSVVQQSGQGDGFDASIPGKLREFDNYLVSISETDTVPEMKDYMRRFHFWLREYGAKRTGKAAKSASRIEEINRAGDESLALARQMLIGMSHPEALPHDEQ